MNKYYHYLIAALLFFASCKTAQQPATPQPVTLSFVDYRITPESKVDSSFLIFLKPYGDSVNRTMNKVIGFATIAMYKKQPESVLGNFMAEAMLIMAEEKFKTKVHASFVNYGGIRSHIPKGDVTVGNIFEIMPFDNLVVLQQMNGKTLQQFLDLVANRGGWPCAGITYQLQNKKAINILVDGKQLDENAVYTIANSDYVANGGDDAFMLKVIKPQNLGYIFRDALIEYTNRLTKQGKPVNGSLTNRVTNAN